MTQRGAIMPELNKIYCGDVLEVLRTWPDAFVQTVVTSPPYWGLRDYGTARWEGGDPICNHAAQELRRGVNLAKSSVSTRGGAKKAADTGFIPFRVVCGKCGAIRYDQQIGLEKTPEEYVAKMVEVFREVRRVLRKDGTCWLNLGDCYMAAGCGGQQGMSGQRANRRHTQVNLKKRITKPMLEGCGDNQNHALRADEAGRSSAYLKPKDLCMIPARVALALQSDGWYLRSDIIWHKPNPMPESVTDRPTKAHEYIFLLAKSEKYFYDAEAIKDPWVQREYDITRAAANHPGYNGKHMVGANGAIKGQPVGDPSTGRNKRSVWTVATAPYTEAHFATFPPDLIKPCILAGSRQNDIVLDPFMGAGTTALVAAGYNRRFLGVELNHQYIGMAERRISGELAQGKLAIA